VKLAAALMASPHEGVNPSTRTGFR
jgi:hypothetical protein